MTPNGISNGFPTLVLENCHFPVSMQPSAERNGLGHVSIFSKRTPSSGMERLSKLDYQVAQAAWGMLLHRYLLSDTVSFALLSGPQSNGLSSDHVKRDPCGVAEGVWLCQYHHISDRQLGNWSPDMLQPLSRQKTGATQVNTAIRLSSSLPLRDEQQDTGLAQISSFQSDGVDYSFDLILNIYTVSWMHGLSMTYPSARVSKQYALACSQTYRKILLEIAHSPGDSFSQLDCISEDDKQRMLSWNPKELPVPTGCVHHLVRATTQSNLDSEAVYAWDGSLSYAQLDALSSIVAQELVRAGVRRGDYIPFAFEKSLWTVVATLGILKAGGAFVPLDPAQPPARLNEILSQTNASMVVTSKLSGPLFKGLGKRVLVVSAQAIGQFLDHENDKICLPSVDSHDPVLILFTSGSTGQPKGMIHEHGAFSSYIIAHGKAMGYQKARVLQFSAYTWDIAILDIYTTLTFGGCICIPKEDDRVNNVAHVINNMQVDYAVLTPSFANLIDPEDVPSLRTLALTGESLTMENVETWKGKVRLISAYGPAEAGICILMCSGREKAPPETVGYPLNNSSCWLVDPNNHNRLVPTGAIGELVVAGPSLAREYLNDPIKSQSSFVTGLAWAEAMGLRNWRFYKTGDLLRYNVDSFDGSYDFIRRKDTQIKVNGQRVEPGEIEHHLGNIAGVVASIVVQPKEGCFAGRLVAITQMCKSGVRWGNSEPISIDSCHFLSLETLRDHLSHHLPGYMIPSASIVVTVMPFTSSYKTDRKAVETWLASMLSKPTEVAVYNTLFRTSSLEATEVTANAISCKVAEMLAQKDEFGGLVLQGQDFLLQNIGFDSLKTTSLAMFLQKTYRVKLRMSTLMSSETTIRHLANLIDNGCQHSATSNPTDSVELLERYNVCSAKLLRNLKAQFMNRADGRSTVIRNVFLTGATGFLGLGILRILMARGDIHAFALIRCSNDLEGLERIVKGAKRAGWWQDVYSERIHVWRGDLEICGFGLSDSQLQCLRGTSPVLENIHAIIHNGAKVHYGLDYESLKSSNVSPTLELLEVTAAAPTLSTFVYVSGGKNPSLVEEDELQDASSVVQAKGYIQSKYVSETLVKKCFGHVCFQGKQLRVVNPGYIIGSPDTGLANQTDFIWRLIAGCLEIKAYNEDEKRHWLPIADVDTVAGIVVDSALGLCEKANGSVPILDGLLFEELWSILREEFGYELQPLGQAEWLAALEEDIMAKGERHLLFAFASELSTDWGSLGSKHIPEVEYGRTKKAIRRNVEQLVGVGFLPPPPKQFGSRGYSTS